MIASGFVRLGCRVCKVGMSGLMGYSMEMVASRYGWIEA